VVRASRLACVEAGGTPNAPSLPYASKERARLAALARSNGLVDASPSPATYSAIEALLKEGETGIFHVIAHGEFSAAQPDESSLRLADGRLFRAEDLHGPLKTAICKARPLVFLNACRIGQQGWSMTGLGGWARRWVDICGCGAFLGPLWAVRDRLAYEFARVFYDALERGETLGTATQTARLHVRELAPTQLGGLAYSAYSHPNGRVILGRSGGE
jgi:CHAT domain-containing protein